MEGAAFTQSIRNRLARIALAGNSQSPGDLQSQIETWRLSQPDLIDCPLCTEKITLRSCTTRQESSKHYWKKVNYTVDSLEVAEGFWKCRDSGCKYYKLPDKGKRAQCYKHGGFGSLPTKERLNADV